MGYMYIGCTIAAYIDRTIGLTIVCYANNFFFQRDIYLNNPERHRHLYVVFL
jgi:hypothetical protein